MTPPETPPGTWPLFTFRGIRVFLHWSWLLVAIYQINHVQGRYPHIGWDVAQYLVLFGIVLLHEFGHAFATRQVGGTAERILLWPFGGIAYVQTPPRPGAYLWAIVAGPLVNVVLWPVFYFLAGLYCDPLDFDSLIAFATGGFPDPLGRFLYAVFFLNTVLIIFNLIPAYPLDGGQIFRGLLWYLCGPVKSLEIAAWVGLVLGGTALLYVAFVWQDIWLSIMMGLIVFQSWSTVNRIRLIRRQMKDAGHAPL